MTEKNLCLFICILYERDHLLATSHWLNPRSSCPSHSSLSMPFWIPLFPLKFPFFKHNLQLFLQLLSHSCVCVFIEMIRWAGDDGCIWGLRGWWCGICQTCSSKDSVSSSLSSNGTLRSLRHGVGGAKSVRVCVCVYVRVYVCADECMMAIEKRWRVVAGVPEDGIKERQRVAAGNE